MNWPALFTGLLGRRDEGRHAVSSPRVPPALAAGQQDLDAREREIIAAHPACRTKPAGTGALCACDFRCANFWLREARQGRPSWTPALNPARHAAPTTPIPLNPARPYVQHVRDAGPLDHGTPVWPDVRPVIGDAMAEEFPMPAVEPEAPAEADQPFALRWLEASEADGRESTGLPYTEPGWTKLQIGQWVANGEWEPLRPAFLSGYERNAAAEGVSLVRNRARIAEALALGCSGLGLPALADELLRRTSELTAAARAANTGGAR